MDYNIDVRTISTSSSLFESYVRNEWLYVDKSEYAYKLLTMAEDPVFAFMARPRRFGKSLFVSMLESARMGKKEMFEGLYLGSSDYDFHPYPVIHLDMSKISDSDIYEDVRADLVDMLSAVGERFGIDLDVSRTPAACLQKLIEGIYRKTGERVAILIDEYDSILTNSIRWADGKRIRMIVHDMYGKLKPCADKIRFLFITGITRFSNQSIFSKLNILRDLTMDKEYATAFGYTQQELESYFAEALDAEVLSGLKKWYDGYRFADGCEKVYNPISINMYFSTGNGFEPYWGDTASTSLVVDLARRTSFALLPGDSLAVDLGTLKGFLIESLQGDAVPDDDFVRAYLSMAGYLTLDRINGDTAYLTIPNHEVELQMTGVLSDIYISRSERRGISGRIKGALTSGDMDALASAFDEIIRIPTYDMRIDLERFYQSLIYSIAFYSDGVEVRAEEHTAEGRADLVLLVPGRTVIVELKRNRSAEAAVRQIEGKGYMAKYLGKGNEVVLMGVNISTRGKRLRLSWAEKRIPSHT